MAHVFISYSSKHRDLTETLAAFLEGCGLDVWWDRELAAIEPFAPQIREGLRTAGCVVVLWTPGAIASAWVKEEADFAFDNGSARNKLVSVTDQGIDWSSLPHPYNTFEHHRPFETNLILRDVLAVREGRLLLEDKREDLAAPDARTPTMLLQAKYRLVPFTGSTQAKDDLVDWALGRNAYVANPPRAAGRLIHGPGGLGKTRLLIEVAEHLREKRWSAGFLARPGTGDRPGDTPEMRSARRERQAKALGHLIRGATDRGLLLIIDYAEDRSEEIRRLAQQIQGRPADDTRLIRLVLLTRAAGDWWTRLVTDDQVTRALFGGEQLDVHGLPGMVTPRDRSNLFLAAIEAFAPKLIEMKYAMRIEGVDLPATLAETRVLAKRLEGVESNAGYDSGEGYDRPLAVAMEALLSLTAVTPGASEPGVHNLLANILGLERDHWPKLVPLRDENGALVASRLTDLERAVGQITTVQGVEGRRAAEALFMADRYYEGQRQNRASVREVTDNVFKIYGRGDLVAQLEPDLIGEHHVGLVADKEMLDGCLEWIKQEKDKNSRTEKYRNLLTVLQRASRAEHGPAGMQRACNLLDYLISQHGEELGATIVRVMSGTPGALFGRLRAQVESLSEATIEAINFALPVDQVTFVEPKHEMVSLGPAGSRLAQLARSRRPSITPHRFENGLREEVVATRDQSVTFYNRLTESLRDPSALILFSLRVAERHAELSRGRISSSNGLTLSESERHEALERLVASLIVLVNRYLNISHQPRAAATSEELVRVCRRLAKDRPAAYLSYLAWSLDHFGNRSLGLGVLRKKRSAALKEAIGIYRRLVKHNSEIYLVGLARSLYNRAWDLMETGVWRRKAIAVFREASAIYRRLARDRPDTYLPDFAFYLYRFSGYFYYTDPKERVAVLEEAVDVYRRLVKSRPELYSRDLWFCLRDLHGALHDVGRHQEAALIFSEGQQVARGHHTNSAAGWVAPDCYHSEERLC
jgi:tetratricopeptide (TPR) repeat protein